jgi:ABC-type branched-subunit amino acid transport system ATPase component
MIKVENLTKAFGAKLAVDDVSFEVNKGEVLGFLGPNGRKTTTMHDHRLHPPTPARSAYADSTCRDRFPGSAGLAIYPSRRRPIRT